MGFSDVAALPMWLVSWDVIKRILVLKLRIVSGRQSDGSWDSLKCGNVSLSTTLTIPDTPVNS